MSMKTYYRATCDKCGMVDYAFWSSPNEVDVYLTTNGWAVDGDDHTCHLCNRVTPTNNHGE